MVFTSLAKEDADKGYYGPLIPGQSAEKLPAACDMVAYCEMLPAQANKPASYTMHFSRRGHWPARSRISNFPAKIKNFDFAKVAHLVVPLEDKPQQTAAQ